MHCRTLGEDGRFELLDADRRRLELGSPGLRSVASMVSRLRRTSSWKWSVLNVRPGRSDSSIRTGPRPPAARDDAHPLALREAVGIGIFGEMSSDSPRRSGEV
jgi:hypothetical protein